MLTVRTNGVSTLACNQLTRANNCIKTSLERLSTGYRINSAKDDAANLAISKNMDCQISGNYVAQDNVQQGMNLLDIADGALDTMTQNAQRIRDLCLQAMNGTYSNEERKMMQSEVEQLTKEIYREKNTTSYNQIKLFEETETKKVIPLTEEEAIEQGYTCVHNEDEFMQIKNNPSGKYCLMSDIDFSKISSWGNFTFNGELNGNCNSINNLTINNTINSGMYALFYRNNGKIENLNINNVDINKKNVSNVCGLVSNNRGTITNCSLSGTIIGGSYTAGLVSSNESGTITDCSVSVTITGTSNIGGLVSYNGGTITNCSVSGNISGQSYVGGFSGENNSVITNCFSSCTVDGLSEIVGGFTGLNYNGGAILNSFTTSNVTGKGSYTGGFAGLNESAALTDCSASGAVTGVAFTGGLVGDNLGAITNCSAFGDVIGTSDMTGGLAGCNYMGTISKSYSTGNVKGANFVGGITGGSSNTISDSYSLSNVTGSDFVGGVIGMNGSVIVNSYSTGTVSSTGSYVGGFVAMNGGEYSGMKLSGTIDNSYSSSSPDFYGYNYKGTVSDCHGVTNQEGVTGHDSSWFNNGSNLSFLGSAFDTSIIPPDIKGNERSSEPPVPEPTERTVIDLQVGANSGEDNVLSVTTGFSINNYTADVTTMTRASITLKKTDNLIDILNNKRSELGASKNRLESVLSSQETTVENLSASNSTIKDTDFASETATLTKNQILQNMTASLVAQANISPQIALKLLQ